MPAQLNQNKTQYYARLDTAPPLMRCLKGGSGEPIDLSGATVTISISYAMRSGGFVLFPRDLIVREKDCDILDQTVEKNLGWVSWTPDEGDLTPSGRFQYTFEVTYQDGTHQTVPPNTWLPMVIQPKVGGPLVNSGASSQTTAEQVFPPASGGS